MPPNQPEASGMAFFEHPGGPQFAAQGVNNWNEWALYVLMSLKDMKADLKTLTETQQNHQQDINKLKWQSGLIGAAAGFAVSVILIVIAEFVHRGI